MIIVIYKASIWIPSKTTPIHINNQSKNNNLNDKWGLQEMNCDPEELLNKINKLLNKKNNK